MPLGFGVGVGLPFGGNLFSPARLFGLSEPGVWYDPSDLTTLFQDTAGTTPVTAAGQTVARINDKSGNGLNATQATAASRPTYQVVNGRPCLVFDGSDDFLVTPTITPNIDKVQVFAGVRKLSDAAAGMIVEAGGEVGLGDNRWYFLASANTTTQDYQAALGGINSDTANSDVLVRSVSNFNAPITNVLSVTMDKAFATQDAIQIRANGADQTEATDVNSGVWSGNFAANVLYIGSRAGTSLPFNGQLYSLIVRFGANLDANTITNTETWVNGKTGAY